MKTDIQIEPKSTESAEEFHPLLIGLRAARANLVPGLMVQSAMLVLVLAYYFYPPASALLSVLAEWKRQTGFLFSFGAAALAGGVLPEVLMVAVFQKGRLRRENLENVLFGVFFWGSQGIIVDLFYRTQAWAFGTQVDFRTVGIKVLVDQLIYNPVLAAPLGLAAYEWKNRGYKKAGMSRVLTRRFYKERTFPALIAGWGVWIPLVSLIYSLPSLLQIPLFSLALTFWVMIFAWINRAHQQRA